jgi:hypothetical protein
MRSFKVLYRGCSIPIALWDLQRVELRPIHVDLLRRGTPLYVHVACTRAGYHPDPKRHQKEGMSWDSVYGTIGSLTRMMAPHKAAKNLLETMADEACAGQAPHPSILPSMPDVGREKLWGLGLPGMRGLLAMYSIFHLFPRWRAG